MSPPMLDREIAVDGWRSAWLARDAPVFDIYLCSTLLILSLTTFSINLTASIKSRRDARALEENPNNRASLFARAIRRGINVCRANWFIAVFYLLNALFLACVDAWIGVMAIKKDVGENAGEYDAGFWWELAAYCAYVFVIFFSTLVIVPALQILAATAILARFMRKRGVSTLAEYVPQARAFSTHIAQSWALVTFAIMALWEPMGSSALTRYIILQGCTGSTLAWLDASFAFNFCYRNLADQEFRLSNGGLTEVVRMFADSMVVAHFGEKNTLSAASNDVNEKTPLTQTTEEIV